MREGGRTATPTRISIFDFYPSIRDRVHRNENFVEIIPVFSTFFNFFKKKKL